MRRMYLADLMLWTHNPDPPERVHEILKGIENDDLVHGATLYSGAIARLCWVEFARRRGFFDFEIRATKTSGQVVLTCEAEGKPLHEHPLFDVELKN